MQVSVSTRHGHLSEAGQQKVVAKAEKLLRIFDRLTAIEVVVDLKDSHRPQVDVKVSAEHKHDFVASEQADEMMMAVDAAVHKLEMQLRKYKEKIQTRHRDSTRRVEPSVSEEPLSDEREGE